MVFTKTHFVVLVVFPAGSDAATLSSLRHGSLAAALFSTPPLLWGTRNTAVLPADSSPGLSAKRTESRHSGRRLYPDSVVDGTANPLFAAQKSFGCLNRNVAKQKLDLLQFASCRVAKPSTCPTKVLRR
jgi:hypothetical protein